MLDQLAELKAEETQDFLEGLSRVEQRALAGDLFDWEKNLARASQRRPAGDWSVWAINAGRGFGKTRTGAENVKRWAEETPKARIALVARTHSDLRDILIEGESGLLSAKVSPPWFRPQYEPSKRRLTWPNGSIASTFTGEEPDDLRGPEFDYAWCDELATWKYLGDTWDNLTLALRRGEHPRAIVTTTPRPLRFLRELYADPETIVTGGSTYENRANLPDWFIRRIERLYGGSARGRQELHAEILDEAEGALWARKTIDRYRIHPDDCPDLSRVVVPIDPAVTSSEQSDETGIVAVGMAPTNGRPHYYLLRDVSGRYKPLEWATAAISVYEQEQADRIIGEVNNGGEMVEATLRTVETSAPIAYKAVHASRGKYARAEPIAALYEQGLVHHVGEFPELEDQLCNWVPNTNQRSPDRLDAIVWGLTELSGSEAVDEVVSFGSSSQRDRTSPWRM